MPKFDNYFVVEFRIPVRVDDSSSVQEALSKANRICQRQHGFKPDNWYARIFEYTTGEDVVGPFKEYFYNPYSATYREITKNHGYHNDLIKAGINPEDGFDYEQVSKNLELEPEIDIRIEDYDGDDED
jgi:hypothetical protein